MQGWVSGQWVWGTTLYLTALVTVLGKAALISEYVSLILHFLAASSGPRLTRAHLASPRSIWTKYTLAAIPGSFAFTMVFLPLYAWIAPMLGFSLEYDDIVGRLWTSLMFWLTMIGIPVLLLTRDFAWKSYKRLFRPEPYHIVQEIQKYNLPDYRPRMEQFQKVRFTQPRLLSLGQDCAVLTTHGIFFVRLAGHQEGPSRTADAPQPRLRVLPVRPSPLHLLRSAPR